jgi:hypothetical protein
VAKVTVDGQVYDYDPERMLNTEAIALQKVTGFTISEWLKALQKEDAFALTALVWLLWRRSGREVEFDEVEFDIGQLDIEDDKADEDEAPDPTPPAADDEPEVVPT